MKNAGRGLPLAVPHAGARMMAGRTWIGYLLLAPRMPDWRGFSTLDLQEERSQWPRHVRFYGIRREMSKVKI
jgi:hypothetical protein